MWNILQRYCDIFFYRGLLLGKRCIEKNRKQIPLILAVVQYWLISTAFDFVLFPCHSPLIRKSSIPFRFEPRDISPLLSCLTFCCKSNDSSRSPLPPFREKVLECIQNWISFEFHERSFSSTRVFVSFDSTAHSSFSFRLFNLSFRQNENILKKYRYMERSKRLI